MIFEPHGSVLLQIHPSTLSSSIVQNKVAPHDDKDQQKRFTTLYLLLKMILKTHNTSDTNVFTGTPARSAAMPVLFLLSGPKMGFRPTGPLPSACQISRLGLSGQKCRNSPKTVKISNFGHKFAPRGSLVCTICTKFSAFVRVSR